MATETKPATSETRVPQITRDSTSRPTLSVPSRWARPGRARVLARFCLSGSWGARTGARSAVSAATRSTAAPNGARRARAARRTTTQRRSGSGRVAVGWERAEAGSAMADPRVDPAVDEVDHQVAQDEAHGDQQHNALHQRVIAGEDGAADEPADAGQGGAVLGHHRAADERAQLQAEHGDHRDQSVLEHVPTDERPL